VVTVTLMGTAPSDLDRERSPSGTAAAAAASWVDPTAAAAIYEADGQLLAVNGGWPAWPRFWWSCLSDLTVATAVLWRC